MPLVNAMTSENHPCEILSDLYALSKRRDHFEEDHYLFCGEAGNIGFAWQEASKAIGFSLEQCCGEGYEIDGLKACQVTSDTMQLANKHALLNPCPPFYRGEEVSDEVLKTDYLLISIFIK